MAKSKETFERRARERAKKAKAAAKRDRRQSGEPGEGGDIVELDENGEVIVPVEAGPESEVLDQLARLHQEFDDGNIDFDGFEEQKAALMSQLQVG